MCLFFCRPKLRNAPPRWRPSFPNCWRAFRTSSCRIPEIRNSIRRRAGPARTSRTRRTAASRTTKTTILTTWPARRSWTRRTRPLPPRSTPWGTPIRSHPATLACPAGRADPRRRSRRSTSSPSTTPTSSGPSSTRSRWPPPSPPLKIHPAKTSNRSKLLATIRMTISRKITRYSWADEYA